MTLIKRTALLGSLILMVAASGCGENATEEPAASTATDTTQTSVIKEATEADAARNDVTENTRNEAIAPPADIEPAVTAANNNAQGTYQITDSGVGSITTATPFSVEAIQSAFPNMEVTTETQMAEGMEYTIIIASDGSGRAIEVESTMDSQLYRVSATSPQFSGTSGHSIGDSFGDIYESAANNQCSPGVEGGADTVICTAPGSEGVRYVFEGDWGFLQGQLPSEAELMDATLTSIFWNTGNY